MYIFSTTVKILKALFEQIQFVVVHALGFSVLFILSSQHGFAVEASRQHPQGEIWYLREAGAIDATNELESKVLQILKNEEIYAPFLQEKSTSSITYLVRFSNNHFAVMKEADPDVPQSIEREVMAFQMDRLLNMNMVPVTVSRNYYGKKVSLQLYVPVNDKQNYDEIQTDWQHTKLNDLEFFDSMLMNSDRSIGYMHNVLLSQEGRIIAIDHARLMKNMNQLTWLDVEYLSADFIQNLMKLDVKQLAYRFKDLLESAEIQLLIQQIQLAQNKIQFWLNGQTVKFTRQHIKHQNLQPSMDYLVPRELRDIFPVHNTIKISCGKVF